MEKEGGDAECENWLRRGEEPAYFDSRVVRKPKTAVYARAAPALLVGDEIWFFHSQTAITIYFKSI